MITIRLSQNTFLSDTCRRTSRHSWQFHASEGTACAPQLLSPILLLELRLSNITNMQQEKASHTWIRKRSDMEWIQLQKQQNKLSAYNNTGPDRLVATNARARATLHGIQNSSIRIQFQIRKQPPKINKLLSSAHTMVSETTFLQQHLPIAASCHKL